MIVLNLYHPDNLPYATLKMPILLNIEKFDLRFCIKYYILKKSTFNNITGTFLTLFFYFSFKYFFIPFTIPVSILFWYSSVDIFLSSAGFDINPNSINVLVTFDQFVPVRSSL